MRNVYIENKSLDETLETYLSFVKPIGEEEIKTIDAAGRITAEAVFAKVCDPCYNASAMDGIAVRSEDTVEASELNPVTLKKDEFEYVNTGGVIKPSYDSVIMIENVVADGENVIINASSHPWQHIRAVGETVVANEMVIPSKRKIRAIDIGAILASGNETVTVRKKPKVAIIPTGDEMVEHVKDVRVGKLIESNSRVFCALIDEYGGIPDRFDVVRDDETLIENALKNAVKNHDVVLINAGSSAGTKDFTKKIIGHLGTVVAHGLAIKPGKPTVLGIIDDKPVIGVPGYPVSAYTVMDKVVKPVIEKMTCTPPTKRQYVTATLTKRVVSSLKSREFLRVALGFIDGKYFATPLERGAAAIMSMVKADGIVDIDRNVEGIDSGEEVRVELLSDLDSIKRKLVIIGSHDVAIDIIGDTIPVVSAHVGSMGGIFAMKNGACHIAPIHLLDAETGEYNVPFVKKYFGEGTMAIIKGLGRTQGLMVRRGDDRIKSVGDLKGGRFFFANRQSGAGTRLLFDYLLKKSGISKDEVNGYEKEFVTHLAVACAVQNGLFDCGLGVESAANAMGLDFIPVGQESYDFLVKKSMLQNEEIKNFISVLKSDDFREKTAALGGYTFDKTGEIILV